MGRKKKGKQPKEGEESGSGQQKGEQLQSSHQKQQSQQQQRREQPQSSHQEQESQPQQRREQSQSSRQEQQSQPQQRREQSQSSRQEQQSQPQQRREQPQSSRQEQQSIPQQRQEYEQQGRHRQQQKQQQDRKPYKGQDRQQPSEQGRWPPQEEQQRSYEGPQHFQQSRSQQQFQSDNQHQSQPPWRSAQLQSESSRPLQQQPVSPPFQQISQGRGQQWGPSKGVGRGRGWGPSQQQVQQQPPGYQQYSPSAAGGPSTAPGSESPQYPQSSGTQPWGPSAGRSPTSPGSEFSSPQYPQPSGSQPWGPSARKELSPAPQYPQPSDSQQGRPSKGKGKSKTTQSTTVEGGSSILARGDTVPTPSGTSDRPVREVTSAMGQVSLATGAQAYSPRPITAGGDAPSQILPQTSARRGGKEAMKRTIVQTNFFPLNIGNLKTAIHYDVAIIPDRPKKLMRSVMEEFRSKKFKNRWPAYDGNKNLYSSSPLFSSNEISDSVKILEDGQEKEFQVTVKVATYVDLTCLKNYIQNVRGKSPLDMDKPMQALQCVDIVLRSAPAFSCIPVGRSYFTPPDSLYTLGDGAVLYTGFFQAAILGWKPFVNIDVAHKAFPAAVNVVDLLYEFGIQSLDSEIQYGRLDSINKHMKQLKIQYEIPRNQASRRMYRVNELGPTPNKAKFKDDNGRVTTVTEYFKTKKNVSLKYPNLPTLWVGSRNRENRILLPMEFCTILPDQVINKKMTDIQTRNMIKYAATNTETRMKNILNSVSKANYNQNPAMKEFGITVDSTPQEVEARILRPPMLQYKSNKTETVYKGTWSANKFVNGATLRLWTVLSLDKYTRPQNITRLEEELRKCADSLGMTISPPAKFTELHNDRNLERDLHKYFTANKNFQMIVVILNNRGNTYNFVKQTSEIAVGCLTQCLKSNTVGRLSASTVSNILLKINAKLNGESHYLHGLPSCLGRPTIIMGADVTHPGPDSRDFPSVAAVTASMDAQFFRYGFEWRLQPARQEMIQDLQQITRNHLLNFYRKNNKVKPEKIIYVRDGVSDGQFVQVLNVELMAIRAACTSLGADYKPPIVFIVVQKRHHTRFFPKDKSISQDRNFNVPAGTCVDTEITHPSIIDFYLVSHASIQGVAKPTKYVKLWDDCNLSEDEIEKLMYYLCHMFARCNRSVSYPAPTYYAHLAAARARVYCEINQIDMNNLAETQRRLKVQECIIEGMPMFFV